MSYLPHRYPMLMVDRIEELEESSCVAIKNVTINEPFFVGHYPGFPIMPGVLIIEAMAQAGAVILLCDKKYEGLVPIIGNVDEVKFRRQVVPGDQLRTHVSLLWMRGAIGRIKCEATVEGDIAATMELTFKLVPIVKE
ncbi:MAG: 3-hydroxyacyl-ACP dehydratase FabZ [Chthonomonas sp.]|nr:3-hydroxyacyl-ACP dehydratase FabZ [Chthonomonas sp.]